jgi:hypothetical protein
MYGHYAVRHCDLHGKGACAVRQPFAVRDSSFFNFFIYVLFFLLLMFISQLVLYFVDYLLVLLNTICILLTRVGAAARCVRGRKRAGRRGREEKCGKKRAGGKGREEKGRKKRAGGKGREEKGGKTRQRAGGKGLSAG